RGGALRERVRVSGEAERTATEADAALARVPRQADGRAIRLEELLPYPARPRPAAGAVGLQLLQPVLFAARRARRRRPRRARARDRDRILLREIRAPPLRAVLP